MCIPVEQTRLTWLDGAQVCYKRGYSGSSSRQRAGHYGMEVQDEDRLDFSRSLQEVVVGRDERVHARRSHRDVACLDFLAVVGSRVDLLQVRFSDIVQDCGSSLTSCLHLCQRLVN